MIYDYDMIVIGGGSAGMALADRAAQAGVKILLVEEKSLGGDCVHYDCLPSRSLARSAKVAYSMTHAEESGLQNMRPAFDWKKILERVADIQKTVQKKNDPRLLRDVGCDVVFAKASFIDAYHINIELTESMSAYQPVGLDKSVRNMKVTGKKIVIATGVTPTLPVVSGLQETGFITNGQLFSLPAQPASVGIIGDTQQAVETAQTLARLGTKVTLFITGEKLLDFEDKALCDVLGRKLEDEGIQIIKNAQVDATRALPTGGKQVVYVSAGITHTENVTEILVAVGRIPNIRSLNLDAAELKYDKSGIIVDAKMRTNKKNIFAIGGVNGKGLSHQGAAYEADIVFSNEVLHRSVKADHTEVASIVFTDPEIASIGYNEKRAYEAGIKYTVAEYSLKNKERALAEDTQQGLIRVLVGKKEKILGCQIVAPHAGEMIREWQLAIGQGMSLSKVAQSVAIYPSFGEASQQVARQHCDEPLFSKRKKKILRILFGYRGK